MAGGLRVVEVPGRTGRWDVVDGAGRRVGRVTERHPADGVRRPPMHEVACRLVPGGWESSGHVTVAAAVDALRDHLAPSDGPVDAATAWCVVQPVHDGRRGVARTVRLTAAQQDGTACLVCGHAGGALVPVGATGGPPEGETQVFAHGLCVHEAAVAWLELDLEDR